MAAADVDIAGAAATTLKEATSPAEHFDHATTTYIDTNSIVYIQPTPAAITVPGKSTKRKKRDIRGEA